MALEIAASGTAELAFEHRRDPAAAIAGSAILLLGGERLVRFAADPLSPDVVSLDGEVPLPRIARLRLSLPGPVPEAGAGALRLLQAEIAALGRLRAATAGTPGPWRIDWRGKRSGMAAEARAAIGLGATLPILPAAGRRDIGFLLPLFAFAGLEKVVMRQAQVLRARGWRTHLVVAGALRMDWGPELAESFDSVTLFQGLGEDRLEYDTGYFGGTTSRMDRDPGAADALGAAGALRRGDQHPCASAATLWSRRCAGWAPRSSARCTWWSARPGTSRMATRMRWRPMSMPMTGCW